MQTNPGDGYYVDVRFMVKRVNYSMITYRKHIVARLLFGLAYLQS